jgi:serine/threonine-protein kinase
MKEDTGSGVTVGTVEYLSPEQARGAADLDVRSDLYAVGATIHHLVTGQVPIKGKTDEETLAKQVLSPFRPDRLRAAKVSEKLVNLVTRLLSKDREERPANAEALIQELEARWPALAPPAPAPVSLAAPAPEAPAPAPPPAPPPGPSYPKLVSRKGRDRDEPEKPAKRKRR